MLISVLNVKLTCEWHKAIKLNYVNTRTKIAVVLRVPSTLHMQTQREFPWAGCRLNGGHAQCTCNRARAKPDGTRAETSFRLSPKRTSPFKSAGESVQSTAGSRGVRISFSNAGYTTSRGRVRVLATHSIRQFPLHFPSRASPCATTFRTQYTSREPGTVRGTARRPHFSLAIISVPFNFGYRCFGLDQCILT